MGNYQLHAKSISLCIEKSAPASEHSAVSEVMNEFERLYLAPVHLNISSCPRLESTFKKLSASKMQSSILFETVEFSTFKLYIQLDFELSHVDDSENTPFLIFSH